MRRNRIPFRRRRSITRPLFLVATIALISILLAFLICMDLVAGGRGGGLKKDNDWITSDPETPDVPIFKPS